jgi:hypothetical protein
MNYNIGSADPVVFRDLGAGAWNSEPQTLTAKAEKQIMLTCMPAAVVAIGHHAARHLRHYLTNSGANLEIDLAAMIASVASAKDIFNNEMKEAREFTESLPPGEYQITSSEAQGGYNIPQESKDWFYAVGGYSAWGKAAVIVPPPTAKPRLYTMVFEYRFFDQYNWNKGIGVPLGRSEATVEWTPGAQPRSRR